MGNESTGTMLEKVIGEELRTSKEGAERFRVALDAYVTALLRKQTSALNPPGTEAEQRLEKKIESAGVLLENVFEEEFKVSVAVAEKIRATFAPYISAVLERSAKQADEKPVEKPHVWEPPPWDSWGQNKKKKKSP